MNIIAPLGIDDDLAKQSLRIIGNTCAQTGWATNNLPIPTFIEV